MEKIKKILYWCTLLPPIFDAFIGFVKGVKSIIELGKANAEFAADLERSGYNKFVKDNIEDD